jgi:3-oxoacyl-[acyl-carrier protein] reductase
MIQNRIAIVTGVTRLKGIGKAIYTELANQGYDIFFTFFRDYDRTMPWGVDDNQPGLIQ